MEDSNYRISFTNELVRKSIHLASSIIPISYLFLSREFLIIVLLIMVIAGVSIDLLRHRNDSFKAVYLRFIGPILRQHEFKKSILPFTGATYVAAAYLICVIIFPGPIAISSMLVLAICDSCAAIAGRSFGKHFIWDKTLEGSLAFFLSGIFIVIITPKVTASVYEYYIGASSVLLTTLLEIVPVKIDDNLVIPLFFGLIYFLQIKLFL